MSCPSGYLLNSLFVAPCALAEQWTYPTCRVEIVRYILPKNRVCHIVPFCSDYNLPKKSYPRANMKCQPSTHWNVIFWVCSLVAIKVLWVVSVSRWWHCGNPPRNPLEYKVLISICAENTIVSRILNQVFNYVNEGILPYLWGSLGAVLKRILC